MKKTFLILMVSLFLQNCKQEVAVTKDAAIKKEVAAIVNNWHQAATDAHFENYFSKMDSTAVFIGTDATEKLDQKNNLKISANLILTRARLGILKRLKEISISVKTKRWFGLTNYWIHGWGPVGVLEY